MSAQKFRVISFLIPFHKAIIMVHIPSIETKKRSPKLICFPYYHAMANNVAYVVFALHIQWGKIANNILYFISRGRFLYAPDILPKFTRINCVIFYITTLLSKQMTYAAINEVVNSLAQYVVCLRSVFLQSYENLLLIADTVIL